jgi:hypothetical protein
MSNHPIRIGRDDRVPVGTRPEPELAWSLLGAAGLAFAVVAATDLVLVWVPPRFGDGGWEFDTITAVLSGMPLLAMGLGLAYGAALARRHYLALRVLSAVLIALALLLAGIFTMYLMRVPSALGSVENQEIRLGLMKAVIKTGGQGVVYPVAFLWLGLKGWVNAPRV